ncbi:MAG: MBL fold metallo-hydrolase [Bacteroidota bacterium]
MDHLIKIKRVANACVLIQIGDYHILTDPFFKNWPIIGIREPIGIEVEDLPPLTAIIGCHDFIDHWQMSSMKNYKHDKNKVQIFVARRSMVRKARKFGFRNSYVLKWGDKLNLTNDLLIEAVKAQKILGLLSVNNYVLSLGQTSVFFGSEARNIEPLEQYYANNGPVDIALLPTNSVHLFGLYKLVLNGAEAVKATQILRARALVVIHDAHPSIPGLIHVKSSGADAERMAAQLPEPKVDVVRISPGTQWEYNRSQKY